MHDLDRKVSEALGTEVASEHWRRANDLVDEACTAPPKSRADLLAAAMVHALQANATRETRTGLKPELDLAYKQVSDELKRADAKATTLFSLVGAVLAGAVALNLKAMPVVSSIALWCSAVPLTLSVFLLLFAIKPHLGNNPKPGTWLHAALHGAGTLLSGRQSDEVVAEQVTALSKLARRKHGLVSRAVWLLGAGLALMLVAGVTYVLMA